ncbi:50S ribosomal protein L23 [bacterium]|nr:50S ribosomal protein L23 [bacterium]
MKTPYNIILAPLLTEKGTGDQERNNVYLFKVARNANKHQIKSAIEELFKVRVLEVRTSLVPSKLRRYGRWEGRKPGYKKAYVKLRKGDKIPIFEGV